MANPGRHSRIRPRSTTEHVSTQDGLIYTVLGFQTFKKAALTSDTFLAKFLSLRRERRERPSLGMVHLLTPHHHLRILAPTLCPLNLDDRFQCRQPWMMRFHSTP